MADLRHVLTASEIAEVFADLEATLPFTTGADFDGMLTFADNLQAPIHRWYYYKEGFSYRLVETLLDRYPLPPGTNTVLDPFCGAGTTLVVARNRGLNSIGIELNPFAAFAAGVKTQWDQLDRQEIQATLERVLNDNHVLTDSLPGLSTFHNEQYFPNGSAQELFRIGAAIRRRRSSPVTKSALMLALAASIESVSHLHKDGRLLRYHPRQIGNPGEVFASRVAEMVQDIEAVDRHTGPATTLIQGDGRTVQAHLGQHAGQVGIAIYSPPYLNNFDYSEVYKCELWLLGFIQSYEAWRSLRKRTFRSHHSCRFEQTSVLADRDHQAAHRLVHLLSSCPDMGGSAQRLMPSIIRGYFDDVTLMMEGQYAGLAPGGYAVCVVGNSQHGNLHVPTDTLISLIGQSVGFELVQIYTAKLRNGRKRRDLKLRESLVVLRKPERKGS